jgi:uncharacterized repeat protein (TIGR01451 family)
MERLRLRQGLRAGVVALAWAWAPAAAQATAASMEQASNPIAVENALPGTTMGLIPTSPSSRAIEGYASEVSALPGNTLHFHVSTDPAAGYRVEVYRLGWYGGAGSRLIGCVPSCTSLEAGQPQPPPTASPDGLVQAGWPVTDTFQLPKETPSGYYRIRFVLAGGQSAATYVIVRAPPGEQSAVLVQVPVNTWQAYNSWGGSSLYNFPAARANRVSFDRPYTWSAPGGQSPLGWEYPLVLFLEQSGYDVSYQTDLDTDQNPASLLDHRLLISIGHDEYWTQAMRDAFTAARDSGVNLAFMGSNDVYWRVRYDDGGRTIVDYKSGDDPVTDPTLRTGLFRVVDTPECQLVGIQHQGGELNWSSGDYALFPAGLTSLLGQRWFAGTGLTAGSVLTGIVGVETDTIPSWDQGASCGHQLTLLFARDTGGDTLGNADATAYTAPSGAVVFAAGSRQFAWGLADPPTISGLAHGLVDSRLQRFVSNMLNDLAGRNQATLTVTLSTRTRTVAIGKAISVLVLVSNHGPDPAPTTRLTLTLPNGINFVRVASNALRCTLAPLQCALAQLPAGETISATFTLRATAAGTDQLKAHAFSTQVTDPNPDSATQQLPIHCHPHTSNDPTS